MLVLIISLGFAFAAGLILRGFNPFTSQQRELTRNDRQLVSFAMAIEGLEPQQQAYISYMGDCLRSYSVGYTNNLVAGMVSAFIVLAANYSSVGVTGSGLFPCEKAKAAAFAINLISALVAGTSQLFLFDNQSNQSLTNASKLRWELWQFVGSSKEYHEMPIAERYAEFTRQTDKLLETSFLLQGQVVSPRPKTRSEEAGEISNPHSIQGQQP